LFCRVNNYHLQVKRFHPPDPLLIVITVSFFFPSFWLQAYSSLSLRLNPTVDMTFRVRPGVSKERVFPTHDPDGNPLPPPPGCAWWWFLLVLAVPGAGLAAAGAVLLTGRLTSAGPHKKHDDAQFMFLIAAGAVLVALGVSCAIYRKSRADTGYAAWKAAEPAAAELFEAKGGYAAVKLVPQGSASTRSATGGGRSGRSRTGRVRALVAAGRNRGGGDSSKRQNAAHGGRDVSGEAFALAVPVVAHASCSDDCILSSLSDTTEGMDDDDDSRGLLDGAPVPTPPAARIGAVVVEIQPTPPVASALLQPLLASSGGTYAAPCYGATGEGAVVGPVRSVGPALVPLALRSTNGTH
jgi:hypothetical protein